PVGRILVDGEAAHQDLQPRRIWATQGTCMVSDSRRLRAAIFERSGIAIDEHDPIMAVLIASAEQTEEIGARLLNRTSPVRIVVATAVAALLFTAIGASGGWYAAQRQFEGSRA